MLKTRRAVAGFGIPLLEAMASGTPVASSNTTSMPEVVGPHAVMFDPFNIDHIAHALRKVWENCDEREYHAQSAIDRAWSFSHQSIDQQISKFWEKVK